MIQRKHSIKKWSQIYSERVDELIERRETKVNQQLQYKDFLLSKFKSPRSNSSLNDDESSIISGLEFDSPSVMSNANQSLMSEQSCKRSETNLAPPPKQIDWKKHWGTQLMCYICSIPAINDCIVCTKCNLIAHARCVAEEKKKNNFNNNMSNSNKLHALRLLAPNAPAKLHPTPEYKCPYCEETFNADMQFYNKIVANLRLEKLRNLCATVIAKRILIFLEKRRLAKKKICIIFLQAFFRGKLMRMRYHAQMRTKPRLVLIHFKQLPAWLRDMNAVVVVTVHDTFKDAQLFRYDKTLETALTETIMIPGITWYMTMIVNIAVKEDGQNFALLGQSQLAMRDIVDILKRKEIKLDFADKITWMPQEIFGAKHYHLTIPVRSYSTLIEPNDFSMRFDYLPQNPVTAVCQMVFAPPLDILKRSAEVGMKKKKTSDMSGGGSAMYRNSRYWICLHKLKLWFFQYYSDASPRFMSDVSEATSNIVMDKGRPTSLINLVHADQRTWLLEFSSKQDAVRFDLALNESKKALTDVSIYSDGKEYVIEEEFGFAIPTN